VCTRAKTLFLFDKPELNSYLTSDTWWSQIRVHFRYGGEKSILTSDMTLESCGVMADIIEPGMLKRIFFNVLIKRWHVYIRVLNIYKLIRKKGHVGCPIHPRNHILTLC